MGRNILRDSGYHNWDLSIFKNFDFGERFGDQRCSLLASSD